MSFSLSSVTIPASDETTAAFDVIAIVDPLSKDAQKIAPLLGVSHYRCGID